MPSAPLPASLMTCCCLSVSFQSAHQPRASGKPEGQGAANAAAPLLAPGTRSRDAAALPSALMAPPRRLEVQNAFHEQASGCTPPPPPRGACPLFCRTPHWGWHRMQALRCMPTPCMQTHASKVTAISFSPEGAALWTGCDAAAPTPTLDSSPDLPVAVLNSLVSCLTCQIW